MYRSPLHEQGRGRTTCVKEYHPFMVLNGSFSGIVWTAKMVQPRVAAETSWLFDKIFGDDDFIAAGQLIIPPKGRKPSKAAKDNTYASSFPVRKTQGLL